MRVQTGICLNVVFNRGVCGGRSLCPRPAAAETSAAEDTVETLVTEGVVLRATEYKEYDRLIRIFTPGRAVLTAAVKGVRRPKAKLKFAAQPFSVNEYTLAERNGYFTVTGCSPVRTLYEITYDPDAYAAGAVMLEATEFGIGEIPSPHMFAFLVRALGKLAYGDAPPYAVCVRYLTELLRATGYGREYGGTIGRIAALDLDDLAGAEAGKADIKRLARDASDAFLHEIRSAAVL